MHALGPFSWKRSQVLSEGYVLFSIPAANPGSQQNPDLWVFELIHFFLSLEYLFHHKRQHSGVVNCN